MGKRFLIILLFITIFLSATFKVRDADIWWHLATGKYILTAKHIPNQDVFSYTSSGQRVITDEWLTQIIFYFIYHWTGVKGLILFKALIITVTFIILFQLLKTKGVHFHIRYGVILLAALVSRGRFFERPEIFTFFFLVMYLYVLQQCRYGKRKHLFFLPVLMLLWANMHAGFILGLMLILCYLIGELKNYCQGEKEGIHRIKHLLIIFLLTFAISFLNPNTYHLYIFCLRVHHLRDIYKIADCSPPTGYDYYLFWFMLILTIIVILSNLKKIDLVEVLPALALGLSASYVNRNIVYFALLSTPVLARQINILTIPIINKGIFLIWYGVIFSIFMNVTGFNQFFPLPKYGSSTLPEFGLGIEARLYPVESIRFVEDNQIEGNMYNSHFFGGFLIWNWYLNRPVFFDGRTTVHEKLINRFWSPNGWTRLPELFDTYDIDYCLISYEDIEVLHYLMSHPQWKLVFLDDNNCVYLKNIPKNIRVIRKNEYQFLRPVISLFYLEQYLTDFDKRDKVESEIKRWIKTNKPGFRAHFVSGYWFSRSGKLDQAIDEYKKAIMLYPHSSQTHNNLGITYAQKGLYQEAIKEFKMAICLDRDFKPAKENLKKACR